MDSMHVVRHVLPLPGCLVLLEFEDRSLRVVDLAQFAQQGGELARLANPEYVEQVRVDEEAGTIVWPDDLDLDPDVLYHEGRPLSGDDLRAFVQAHSH